VRYCITVILSFYRIVLFCIILYHACVYCIDFTGIQVAFPLCRRCLKIKKIKAYSGFLTVMRYVHNYTHPLHPNHHRLITVPGSQPAGDVSHKPGGRLPLLFARPTVNLVTIKRAATNFAAW